METTLIEPIDDTATVKPLLKRVAEIVEDEDDLFLAFLAEKGWAAVPVESALHFNEDDARHISAAARYLGCDSCWAVAAEDLAAHPLCYRVTLSVEGLLQFDGECGLFKFLLLPADESFAILCTVINYFIVAGPAPFVERAIGSSLAAGRKEFHEFATDDFWDGIDREIFLAVSKRYEPFNG